MSGASVDPESSTVIESREVEGLRKSVAAERKLARQAEEAAAQAVADKLAAQATADEAKRAAAAEKERADKLAAEHAALTEYKTAAEKQHEARRTARREALGEWAELVPAGISGAVLDDQLTRLEARKAAAAAVAQPAGATQAVPVIPAGAGSAPPPPAPESKVSQSEAAWMAQHHPDWLRCSDAKQRELLDKYGPQRTK